jgi:hypothetical protein
LAIGDGDLAVFVEPSEQLLQPSVMAGRPWRLQHR